jgi:hypothetical protein
MRNKSEPSVFEKLLLAAYELDGGKGTQFTAEELVVAAWRLFPRAFGLRGVHDESGKPIYPDSNRVFAEIMGSKPIRQRGYLVKVGEKTYGLTASGRSLAEQMRSAGGVGPALGEGKAPISRSVRSHLEQLLASRAVRRAQDSEMERITFHDACGFWGITARSKAIELNGAIANIDSLIADAEKAIGQGATELRTGSGGLTEGTTSLLRRVHQHLQERFKDEMETIRKRTDQRVT